MISILKNFKLIVVGNSTIDNVVIRKVSLVTDKVELNGERTSLPVAGGRCSHGETPCT